MKLWVKYQKYGVIVLEKYLKRGNFAKKSKIYIKMIKYS
jgi:hypothetical protein